MAPPSVRVAVALGALFGFAWAAAFRAYMSELAGPASKIDWFGTFGAIVLPGAIVGGLLGWAHALRMRGGRPGWRWLALAPLLFAVAPMFLPGALEALVTEGLGGGAVGVALLAIGGGFAISGRGPLWARIVCGVMSAVLLAGAAATALFLGRAALPGNEARGWWTLLLAASLLMILVLAASIPFRPVLTHAPAGLRPNGGPESGSSGRE
ncbi:hypothetical protein ACLQ2Q_03115 [Microbacterium sp. DT81.1]|uniref:hypothetical protein n=1 Tax=Microbacterium sp. DT81.1 TaxID=3393413 RepID=UPI003CFA2C9B